MARVLIVTAALTLEHLTGEDLEAANEGMPIPDGEDEDEEDCRFTGTEDDLAEVDPSEIADIAVEHVIASNDEIWAGTSIGAKFTAGAVIGAKWQDAPRATTTDRGVVAAIVAEGIPVEVAEDMVERVTRAMLNQLRGGKGVRFPDIGRLMPKKRRKKIIAPGPDRGKGVEEQVVALSGAAVLSRGVPYDLT